MPSITTTLQTPIRESFRVKQVAGRFDLPHVEKSRVDLRVELPGLDEPWTLGAIVGPSGSGKSSIARAAFGPDGSIAPHSLVGDFDWPPDAAVVDGFPDEVDGHAITAALNAVGFSSPPAWLRPHRVLSGGERFRCDLARALLLDQELVVFDEFTSVVDRQVARFGSAAVAKAVRKGRGRCRRFVAVTCHYDVLAWLEPDWYADMASATLARGSVQPRPAVELEICPVSRRLWPRFAPHHYLSAELSPSARCYAATWEQVPIAFCATIPLYGQRRRRIVHRLVVLPDYQGLGVGKALLAAVAERESATTPISIVTSHPALIRSLAADPAWRCQRITKCAPPHRGPKRKTGKKIGTLDRFTASFAWRGPST